MKKIEEKLVSILKDLKENYSVTAVRTEFESEGSTLEESLRLKDIALSSGVNLTVKVGGCEAVRDIYDAKILEASSIIAPMIETPYAVEKFVNAINSVYSETEKVMLETFINVETITGFNNLSEMLNSKYFENISGVVLGRVDMVSSLGLGRAEVDSDIILSIAKVMCEKVEYVGKDIVIGGGVSLDSMSFFKKLSHPTRFETRKIVFGQDAILNPNIGIGMLKATEFEIEWIKNKKELGGAVYMEDKSRQKMLETRYNNLLNKVYNNKVKFIKKEIDEIGIYG